MITGRIHSEESFGTLDGPGIRYVIFMQGCPNRCIYCHNPDTWSGEGSKVYTVDELLKRVIDCRNFIKNGGVTVSGGEPAMQKEFVAEFLKRCRENDLHTALDTSGVLPLTEMQSLLDAADLVLLDVKGSNNDITTRVSGNPELFERAVAVLEYCEKSGKAVWVRHVLIPEYTMLNEELEALAKLLKPFKCIEKVELLAFHTMGFFKYENLQQVNPLIDCPAVTREDRLEAEKYFMSFYRK